jgi:hypothetical protein
MLVAMSGVAAIPAVSDAAGRGHASALQVAVRPASGSPRTQFAVSFRAPLGTGRNYQHVYRITAGTRSGGGCQARTAAEVPPTKAGATVRVVLSPSRSAGWCAGTFHGQVWDELIMRCPVGKACPAIVPAPQVVGRFTFRVTRR